MIVFNYKAFYKAFEKGFIDKNKTAISALLFKPLFEPAELFGVKAELRFPKISEERY